MLVSRGLLRYNFRKSGCLDFEFFKLLLHQLVVDLLAALEVMHLEETRAQVESSLILKSIRLRPYIVLAYLSHFQDCFKGLGCAYIVLTAVQIASMQESTDWIVDVTLLRIRHECLIFDSCVIVAFAPDNVHFDFLRFEKLLEPLSLM